MKIFKTTHLYIEACKEGKVKNQEVVVHKNKKGQNHIFYNDETWTHIFCWVVSVNGESNFKGRFRKKKDAVLFAKALEIEQSLGDII